jgi:hypothetical protein
MFGALLAIGLIVFAAYELFEGTIVTLQASDIATYAQNAGFAGNDLPVAIAIALAESSGNPFAIGDLQLGVSVGLWQINLKAHPEYSGVNLMDPQTNANAAYAIYRAAGMTFSPWSTFKSGAYQANLQTATNAVNA